MNPKFKVLLFNFLCFGGLFIIIRLTLGAYVEANTLTLAIIAAVAASILAPKFGLIETQEGKKIMMKWIFMKGIKEL